MSINLKLTALYSEYWDELIGEAEHVSNITHPLLIEVDETKFSDAHYKVMIFGQETDGWHGEFPKKENQLSIEKLMSCYKKYFYSNRCPRRPFWNSANFKHFETTLTKYFQDKGKKTGFIWNNLSKIGKVSSGKAGKGIRSLELKYLDVIKREVEILKPDIIIFTTGHSRDHYINRAFGNDRVEFIYPSIKFDTIGKSFQDKNNIAKLRLLDFPEITAIRVEHPNRRTTDNNLISNILIDSICHKQKI